MQWSVLADLVFYHDVRFEKTPGCRHWFLLHGQYALLHLRHCVFYGWPTWSAVLNFFVVSNLFLLCIWSYLEMETLLAPRAYMSTLVWWKRLKLFIRADRYWDIECLRTFSLLYEETEDRQNPYSACPCLLHRLRIAICCASVRHQFQQHHLPSLLQSQNLAHLAFLCFFLSSPSSLHIWIWIWNKDRPC